MMDEVVPNGQVATSSNEVYIINITPTDPGGTGL